MKFITEKEYMELIEILKIEFDKIGEKFEKINDRFDRVDQQFIQLREDIKYLDTRVDRIEKNMVHKSQFNNLLIILENKEIISSFEKEHILFPAN